MKFNSVNIESFAYHLPDTILTSDEIEDRLAPLYQRLKLPSGRLELMTGISQRRIWPAGTKPSELSWLAAEKALKKTNIDRKNIGVLIHSSVCRDFLEPATASVVHNRLNLSPDCMIFDLSNACLGVLNSFVIVATMIENGMIDHGLVVSGENSGPLIEETINTILTDDTITRKTIKKYIANLTIGSAAVAFLISRSELSPNGHKIIGGAGMTKSNACKLCQGSGDTNSLMMETNSEELLHAGVELASNTWEKFKQNTKWNNETPDWVVTHQVGTAHEKITMESLELEDRNSFTTYKTLGNTGSAALPVTLIKLAETNDLKRNDHVALLGIGSGLSSIMLGVEW